MDDIAQRIAESILSGASPTHDSGLLSGTAGQLVDCIAKGYTRSVDNIKWDAPDAGMIDNLNRNIYQFSAAKSYQQLRDMTIALHDGERLVSESDFFERVATINKKFNREWLRTERDSAIAASQMASRWVQYQGDKGAIRMLVYRTVGDANVRPAHQALDGITRAADDDFWKTYYPPNGWRCRCDVEQAPERSRQTPASHIPTVPVPEIFRTNLAETGLVFPKEHPYYNGVPNTEIRKAIAYLPPENTYHRVLSDNGLPIEINVMHNKGEVLENSEIANDLCNSGFKGVHLLPDIHIKDAHLRKRFLPEDYTIRNISKNPDAWIVDGDGKNMICDFKALTGERNFAKRISEAAEQADYAVIKLKCKIEKLGYNNIDRAVTSKMSVHGNLKGVIVFDSDGNIIYEATR